MQLGFNPRRPLKVSTPSGLVPPHNVQDWWDFTDLTYTDLTANVPNKGANTANTGAPNGTTAAFGTGENGLRYFNTLGFQTFESSVAQTSKAATIFAVVDLGSWASNNSEPFLGSQVGETRVSVAAATQPNDTLNISYADTDSASFTMGYDTSTVVLVLEFVGGDCKVSAYNMDGTSVTSGDLALATGGTGEYALLAEGLWIGADSNTTLNIPLLKIYEVLMWSGSDTDNTRQLTEQQIQDIGEQYFAVKYNFTWTVPTPPGAGGPIENLNPLLHFDLTDTDTVTLSGSNIIAIDNKGSTGATNNMTGIGGAIKHTTQTYANNLHCWDTRAPGSSANEGKVTLDPILSTGAGNDQTIICLTGGVPLGIPTASWTGANLAYSGRSTDTTGSSWSFQGAQVREMPNGTPSDQVNVFVFRKNGGLGRVLLDGTVGPNYRFSRNLGTSNRSMQDVYLGSRGAGAFKFEGHIFEMAVLDREITDAELDTLYDELDVKYNRTSPARVVPLDFPRPQNWWSCYFNGNLPVLSASPVVDNYNTSTGLVTWTAAPSNQWSAGQPFTFNAVSAPPELVGGTTYYWLPETTTTGYIYPSLDDMLNHTNLIIPSTSTGGDSFSGSLVNYWAPQVECTQQVNLIGGTTRAPVSRTGEAKRINETWAPSASRSFAVGTGDSNITPLSGTPATKMQSNPTAISGAMTMIALLVPKFRGDTVADNPTSQRFITFQDGDGTAYLDLQGATGTSSPYPARCHTGGSTLTVSGAFTVDDQMHAVVYRHDGASARKLQVVRFDDDVTTTASDVASITGDSLSGSFKVQTRHDIADLYEVLIFDQELTDAQAEHVVTHLGAFYNQSPPTF